MSWVGIEEPLAVNALIDCVDKFEDTDNYTRPYLNGKQQGICKCYGVYDSMVTHCSVPEEQGY